MDNTRRIYLDNIRWITVVIVVIYHIIYMFNGVQPFGVIGPFKNISCRMLFNMWFTLVYGAVICCVRDERQILSRETRHENIC